MWHSKEDEDVRGAEREAVMSYDEVCSWLGLPPGKWPPDYYALLGLEPGEADPVRIEHQVHERMFLLRCRQLCHPEQVTEAMNLLARAFTCLTDPAAKKAYDAALRGGPSREAAPVAVEMQPTATETGAEPSDPLAWLFGPWSAATTSTIPETPAEPTLENWVTAPPPPRLPVDASFVETIPLAP